MYPVLPDPLSGSWNVWIENTNISYNAYLLSASWIYKDTTRFRVKLQCLLKNVLFQELLHKMFEFWVVLGLNFFFLQIFHCPVINMEERCVVKKRCRPNIFRSVTSVCSDSKSTQMQVWGLGSGNELLQKRAAFTLGLTQHLQYIPVQLLLRLSLEARIMCS